MNPINIEVSRTRQPLTNGECLRCGHLFTKRKLFCQKCGSPNFLAKPKASAVITVAPFVVIVGFFLLFYQIWQESESLADFADKGLLIAGTFLTAACMFVVWTLRSAAKVRRVRQAILNQYETCEKYEHGQDGI
jgi:predicted  nucleic acid-binding Zn-ribbon protein